MPGPPEVSVVMPVFDAARHLVEAVDSVLAQTLGDWELVAVDDGSSDGSLRILERYAGRDERVRVLSRPRTGIAGARNDGMAAARGTFIACMDNDDVMPPDRLERQTAWLRQNPGCVALGGAALLIDPEGDPLIKVSCPAAHEEIEAELIGGRNPMIQPAVMLRRESVLSIGGYRDKCNFAEDYDLFLRLAEHGRLANLPHVLVKLRQHLSRASFATYRRQHEVAARALAEAWQRRGLSGPVPSIPAPWHPATRRDFHVRCCCDALDGGYTGTARKHARALLALNPFSPRAWDLMARSGLDVRIYRVVAHIKKWLRPLKRHGRSRRASP